VVKSSTHEVGGPKRKHLDYLVTLTGAPNVNLPELANQIVERTRNTSWVVVFKVQKMKPKIQKRRFLRPMGILYTNLNDAIILKLRNLENGEHSSFFNY